MSVQPLLDAFGIQEDADRLPAAPPDLPEHPDYPRISASSPMSPARRGPETSAKPATTNCCRRTLKAPAPNWNARSSRHHEPPCQKSITCTDPQQFCVIQAWRPSGVSAIRVGPPTRMVSVTLFVLVSMTDRLSECSLVT
ncbi:hypothetical protein SCANM63S_07730 [Streptomyces canarius]